MSSKDIIEGQNVPQTPGVESRTSKGLPAPARDLCFRTTTVLHESSARIVTRYDTCDKFASGNLYFPCQKRNINAEIRLLEVYDERADNVSYVVKKYQVEDGSITFFKKPRAWDDRDARFTPNGSRRFFENSNNVIYDVIECYADGKIVAIKTPKAFEESFLAEENYHL
ncbi:unnamed protein product [Clavelina lepadiformis]|uniref:Uncharacterized protein n=1 Tax=Clavelina lepadiformis TaxID=159417 RepID=A0ABP0GW70_CLALP